MINKIITMDEAVGKIKDGMTVMFGGFLGCGNPYSLVDAMLDKGVKDITLIANDTSFPDIGIGKLIVNKRVKKIIVSHIGTNKESGNQMNAGTLEVELVPQGTLAERIRAGGAGLGGVLTPTGVGTVVEKGKQVIELDGKKYILERALKADVALVAGYRVDKKGNVQYIKTTRNFNPLIATAADTVIVEAKEIVEVGEIDPEMVQTPHIFIDYIVRGNK